ncbi:MAG: PaaI family thioesterase [Candidatus Dormibacteraeota bacterium]|uniref:PaaI family thioesterase n=1 Tax=Candidatus Aeolococcus gillhamiae TaxID=3127015 RepID=A0A934N590_9BACT|nr:PaaI family thioesterase [Candidatus Dormibacteraeota bacterium]
MLGTSEFLELLGCHFDEVGAARVTGWFEVGSQHHQPFGILHGGVLSSVVETFASIGAWIAIRDSGRAAVGVANATDFLRSTVAGRLDVVATAVYQGRTQQLWDVVIARADDGKDVARGRVRLQNVEPH